MTMTIKRVKTINGKPHPDLLCVYENGRPVCFVHDWELPGCDYYNDDGVIVEVDNDSKSEA